MVHHIPSFFARALASRAQSRAVLARSIRVPRARADTAKAWQEGASRFCDWPGTVQAAPQCRRICDIFPFLLKLITNQRGISSLVWFLFGPAIISRQRSRVAGA